MVTPLEEKSQRIAGHLAVVDALETMRSRYTPQMGFILDDLFHLIGVEKVDRKHDRQKALRYMGLH